MEEMRISRKGLESGDVLDAIVDGISSFSSFVSALIASCILFKISSLQFLFLYCTENKPDPPNLTIGTVFNMWIHTVYTQDDTGWTETALGFHQPGCSMGIPHINSQRVFVRLLHLPAQPDSSRKLLPSTDY